MPHCDLRLYENLLRENCSQERLPRLLLIANRLTEYMDRCVPTLSLLDVHLARRAAPISRADRLGYRPTHVQHPITQAGRRIPLRLTPGSVRCR